jgi:hypothetical protein
MNFLAKKIVLLSLILKFHKITNNVMPQDEILNIKDVPL